MCLRFHAPHNLAIAGLFRRWYLCASAQVQLHHCCTFVQMEFHAWFNFGMRHMTWFWVNAPDWILTHVFIPLSYRCSLSRSTRASVCGVWPQQKLWNPTSAGSILVTQTHKFSDKQYALRNTQYGPVQCLFGVFSPPWPLPMCRFKPGWPNSTEALSQSRRAFASFLARTSSRGVCPLIVFFFQYLGACACIQSNRYAWVCLWVGVVLIRFPDRFNQRALKRLTGPSLSPPLHRLLRGMYSAYSIDREDIHSYLL